MQNRRRWLILSAPPRRAEPPSMWPPRVSWEDVSPWVRGPAAAAAAAGAGIGAGVMYLLDPDRGRRRRALVRDQAAHYATSGADATGKVGRDLRQRGTGVLARTRRRVSRETPDPPVLAERVRAELGRVSRTPGAINVSTDDGHVRLSGLILRDEHDRVRSTVSKVPGVREVTDELEVHDQPDDIPALQGAVGPAPQPKPEFLQQHWSPGARAVAGAAGGALASYGLAVRGVPGTVAGVSGLALLARAATNLRLARLTGVGAGREAVTLDKSINLNAPPEQVWALWDNYENFPRFMTNVREVRAGSEGRSHWKVAGPLGTTASWEAEVTKRVPGELLAWRTVPGSVIDHTGSVRLEPDGKGGTRAHVRLAYNPVAGAAGLAVSSLLGANPKQRLDEDLLRMKTLVETGRPPHDAARST